MKEGDNVIRLSDRRKPERQQSTPTWRQMAEALDPLWTVIRNHPEVSDEALEDCTNAFESLSEILEHNSEEVENSSAESLTAEAVIGLSEILKPLAFDMVRGVSTPALYDDVIERFREIVSKPPFELTDSLKSSIDSYKRSLSK